MIRHAWYGFLTDIIDAADKDRKENIIRIVEPFKQEHRQQQQEEGPNLIQGHFSGGNHGDDDKHGIGFVESVGRQLGGLFSIYELQRDRSVDEPEILKVAIELGDQLTLAFQEANNVFPANVIFENGRTGLTKVLAGKVSLAEISTFQLEFRELSRVISNGMYKNLAEANFEYLASLNPRIPGLYPAYFDPKGGASSEYVASFGSLSNGFYETYMLTGDTKFKDLYILVIDKMHKHLISQSSKSTVPHLVLGVYDTAADTLVPKMDHLSCFAPELLALGAKVLNRPKDLVVAQTVESLFILYRITGDPKYQEYALTIVQAIEKHCKTKNGYSGLVNVQDPSEGLSGRMPSHFLSQTLKYLYLIFDDPEVGSLDNYLYTTEGHFIKYPIA
ncbi:Mannosyl-oligosaccharide 1,2-alpha-mannosidase IB [Mortierella sp. AD031]|nr:Mannosyl-oligosaccharide 1,2-alpha-mannosidase IB [Mortierella sp. AD031]